ncbi:MAG: MBL fold metallo-hydrolase, partial [Chrysiogenales bacterium]
MSNIGIAVIIMTALTMGIGFWTYIKIKGKAVNYYKAGAAIPVWVIAITLCAQAFDANASMGAASRSYDMGFWAGASIQVGDVALEVRHTPGHSPGSVTFVDHTGRRAFTGDALFAGSIGRTDLAGGSLATLLDSI